MDTNNFILLISIVLGCVLLFILIKSMKINKRVLLISVISIIIISTISGAFYWYEWRPTEIIKKCSGTSLRQSNGNNDKYEIAYKRCLRNNGINK